MKLFQYIEESVDIGLDEDGFGAFGSDADERRLVDAGRFDGAVIGEVVDDQVDEGELVEAVALVVEEPCEGAFGGGPVDADEGADEEPEAAGAF